MIAGIVKKGEPFDVERYLEMIKYVVNKAGDTISYEDAARQIDELVKWRSVVVG